MITVREATSADVNAITGIFQACYGSDYPDRRYYNAGDLTKLISSDDTLVLVAEEAETAKVLGTASVLLEVGAYADLTGERPAGGGAGSPTSGHRHAPHTGTAAPHPRAQLAIIEARTADAFSQRIAEAQLLDELPRGVEHQRAAVGEGGDRLRGRR